MQTKPIALNVRLSGNLANRFQAALKKEKATARPPAKVTGHGFARYLVEKGLDAISR